MAESTAAETDEIRHPFLARAYDLVVPDRWLFGAHRRALATGLEGSVLEIGTGTGAMFPYVDDADVDFHAIEPDPHMRRRAATRARDLDVAVTLRDARAEGLPYEDGSFDVVLASLVFCTIEDPDASLDEVARVLRPGGECRFLEHVRAEGARGRGQRLLNPLWNRVAGGCQLTRRTEARFRAHDEFSVESVTRTAGLFPATPLIRGTLQRA